MDMAFLGHHNNLWYKSFHNTNFTIMLSRTRLFGLERKAGLVELQNLHSNLQKNTKELLVMVTSHCWIPIMKTLVSSVMLCLRLYTMTHYMMTVLEALVVTCQLIHPCGKPQEHVAIGVSL